MYKVIEVKPEIELKKLRIGIVGDTKVGKTSIVNSFLDQEFSLDLPETIGSERFNTNFNLNNDKEIKLIIWDTSGVERYRAIALNTMKGIHGGIIVFDVTSKKSFENVSLWLSLIKEGRSKFYIALFGNKSDEEISNWEVTNEEINELTKKYNLKYFEVSAKTKKGINEGFEYIVNEVYDQFRLEYIVIKPRK